MIQERILDSFAVSPDGRWVVVSIPGTGDDRPVLTVAYATDGSAKVGLCTEWCNFRWDNAGKTGFLTFPPLFYGTMLSRSCRTRGFLSCRRTEWTEWTIFRM